MNDPIIKAIDEAVSYLTVSGTCGYCYGPDNQLREEIATASYGYALCKPGDQIPGTIDDYIAVAEMKDGALCLIDGAGDYPLVEGDNVGAQGIAAIQDLADRLDEDNENKDYLHDYIRDAKRVWLNSLLERIAKEDYEPYVEVEEELSDAASKAYNDDDEDSILYVLDHISDVADILGRL